MLNKEVKKKWLTALRSKKYQQTTKRLKRTVEDEYHYCCLGVLCDISEQGSWSYDPHTGFRYNFFREILPPEVCDWAGMEISSNQCVNLSDCPRGVQRKAKRLGFSHNEIGIGLTTLNDTFKCTFREIANVIERCL